MHPFKERQEFYFVMQTYFYLNQSKTYLENLLECTNPLVNSIAHVSGGKQKIFKCKASACVTVCNSVFCVLDMKKLPQNNMDVRSKQAKANSHTEATDNGSPAPVLRLTFEWRDLELRFCSLLLFLQELHFTGTTLRLALTWFYVRTLTFFSLVTFLTGLCRRTYHRVLTLCEERECKDVLAWQPAHQPLRNHFLFIFFLA